MFIRLKVERDQYEETMKILSNVELKMSEKVKLAKLKVKEHNVEFAKTIEEYEVLHDKLKRKIQQYIRKEAVMNAKNKKLHRA